MADSAAIEGMGSMTAPGAESSGYRRRSQDVQIAELQTWARGHDDLCEMRETNADTHRKQLLSRVRRVEAILISQFGAILLGGCIVIWAILKLYFKLP
jgi:hypothetical protein